jgi:ribose 5-phosphate isomerase B
MISIVIGCDPNATDRKFEFIEHMEKNGFDVTDLGSNDPIYPNTAIKVAKAVAANEYDRGILLCGTGIGMSIAANKVKGAYAALISDAYSAERASKSNNANIGCFGAFTLGSHLAIKLLDIWLSSEFIFGTPSEEKINSIIKYEQRGN